MNDIHEFPALAPSSALRIDQVCDRFEAAWKAGQRPHPEDFLDTADEPERSELLHQLLLLDWDYRLRAGDEPRAGDYYTRFPCDSTLIEFVGREITETSGAPAADGLEAETTPRENGDRYDLGLEIGHGGIGVVFRGRDQLLGRDLAVKVLGDAHSDKPEARRRFINEARVGSQLQHPAIVPVYDFGWFSDRRPYFTMKLVEGSTLAALLKSRSNAQKDLPRLLGIFEQICQAIAYAHNAGVVHRDLKPANVMVGTFGEVQVMDWGFAKLTDDGQAKNSASGDTTSRSSEHSASVSGALMGTPAYMPPEQAQGHVTKIDSRVDVFALGAILCEILTGLPPYGSGSAEDICTKASAGDLRDAHTRLDVCGADEALRILAKRCLSADRASRPANAGEVLNDLSAHLATADERARHAQLERAAAEARAQAERRGRRLTVALAAAIILLILGAAAGPSVGFVLLRAEQKQTKAERQAAVAAREDEARRRQQARQALDMLTGPIVEEWLGKQPQLSPDHKRFLEQALAAYREFTAETAADETSRANLARAYYQVGNMQRLLGRIPEAEEAYDRSVALYTALADETGRTVYRKELVRPVNHRNIIRSSTGRGDQAVAALRDLVQMLRGLAATSPDAETLAHLGLSLTNLGSISITRGQQRDAEAALSEAVTIYDKLIDAHSDQAADHIVSANKARGNLGIVLDMTARPEEAERTYRDALTSLDRLAPVYRDQRDIRQLLGAVHTNLGALLHRVGHHREAEASHRNALEVRRQLVADFPAHPALRGDLAKTHNNLGIVFASLDRRVEAVEAYRQAIAVYEKLSGELPKELDYRSGLGLTHFALGSLLKTMGRPSDAEAADRAAARLYRELAAADPAVPDYQHYLGGALVKLAGWHHERGEWAEARRLLDEALPHQHAAIQARPLHRRSRQFLCANRFQLASTYLAEKDHEGLAKAAAQLQEAAGAEFPSELANAASFLARCVTLVEQDARMPDNRRAELTSSYAERSMTALRLAVRQGYKDMATLKDGPAFASVRRRPDFQELLAELGNRHP
jgi:tetratricopeptide (TPR) repeat protein